MSADASGGTVPTTDAATTDAADRSDTVDELVPEIGEVTSGAPTRRTSRRRTILRVGILAVVLAALGLMMFLRSAERDADPLSAHNPRPGGAQATAEILRDQGVDVAVVDSQREVLSLAGEGTTVLVTNARLLTEDAAAQLAGTGADLVLVNPTTPVLRGLGSPLETTGGGSQDPVQADCEDPDAAAASRIGPFRGGLAGSGADVTTCFTPDDASAYAVWDGEGPAVRALADGSLMSNERLDEDGHAALVLRALGHHENLYWFTPVDPVEAVDLSATPPPEPLSPRWMLYVGWAAGFAVLVLALARGRNLGRVIPEPLPVVVRSAETVRGRGALYRRYGATAHAAAGLRGGAAARLARRLGLPPSVHRTDLTDAVARASGRDEAWVRDLLYGAPPTTGADLGRLATDLDTLESEVHRP
ncbi:DUF4350 domain-containing protein [Georgenia sp. Z1344]|uniref:DUF4350 domain-containing protein n=1 Tax=Georgenia sp. Z1344 TaxID=3416706 RepID=UPI003CEAA555